MKFKSDIEVQAGLKDSSGANGTSGQVLSSNGATVSWINANIGVASDVQNQVKAGVAINKGQAVYVTGADGTNIIVGLASNTTEATSSKTLGLLNATVAVNGFADVVQIGRLAGLDTSTAVVGDPVWLGTNGNLIYGLANKPYAPAHLVFIGVVTRVNANNGEIFITVQNGFELKEIHDVDIITNVPINGDVLGYDGTLWVNKTIAEWLGFTPVSGTGTTNYIPKFTSSTALGNSLIYDNGTNVGIGTTSPAAKLDVNSGTRNTDALILRNNQINGDLVQGFVGISFQDQNGTNASAIRSYSNLFSQWGSTLTFSTNTASGSELAERMRITSGGNVGIGTTSPIDYSVFGYGANVENRGGRGGGFISTDSGATNRMVFSVDSAAAVGQIKTVTNTPLTFGVNDIERMRITSGGNVGIGTASPANPLSVFTSASTIASFTRDLATDATLNIGADNDGAYLETAGINNLRVLTNGSERMRIASNGRVGIGTTAPNYKLSVLSSNNVSWLEDTSGASGAVFALFSAPGNTGIGSIARVGTTSAIAYNSTSDYRLKEDLKEVNGLDKISKIKIYDFKWKNHTDRMDGVMAHELQEVVPYAVTGEKDGEQMQSVDYSKLVPLLIASIQELKAEIEILKNK